MHLPSKGASEEPHRPTVLPQRFGQGGTETIPAFIRIQSTRDAQGALSDELFHQLPQRLAIPLGEGCALTLTMIREDDQPIGPGRTVAGQFNVGTHMSDL